MRGVGVCRPWCFMLMQPMGKLMWSGEVAMNICMHMCVFKGVVYLSICGKNPVK